MSLGSPLTAWSGHNPTVKPSAMLSKIRDGLAIGLFVVLAVYVSYSALRLGLLLWQRFA